MRNKQYDNDRREALFRVAAATALFGALYPAHLWAGGRPSDMDAWAQALVDLNESLQAGRLTVTEWQGRVETLHRSVQTADLVRYLDIERLANRFRYATLLAETADLAVPARATGARRWFARIFGLRSGGSIIPHVHNNMVSAHLVVSGGFRVRTHDRIRDLNDAVVLRPSIDKQVSVGAVLTMSDRLDNQHWLVARADRSLTFDVGVVDVPASWDYRLQANANNMIFVDVDRRPESDGLVIAPILSFKESVQKYANGAA